MATELAMFDPKAGVPAHIAQHFNAAGTNIENKGTVPSLSPQGKTWTIALDGNKTKLMKRDADGETVPVNVLPVVILDFAKRRGRTYYEGAYDPNNEAAPLCWSDDGIAPDETVPEAIKSTRTSHKCDTCPMSAKGSKIGDDSRAMAACSQHRMLAIVPANKLDFEPLRLKIAITSDWDKQSPDAAAEGWHAFQNYLDFLKSRGAQRTDALVTKMKFDPNATYPKIFFQASRWLTAEEMAQVAPLAATEKVQSLLAGTYTPAGPDGVNKHETTAVPPEQAPATAPTGNGAATSQTAATATTTTTQTAASPSDDDDSGEIIMAGLDAPAATPGNSGAQAAKAPVEKPTTTAAPKAAASPPVDAAPPATSTLDPGLADLLAGWTD